MDKISAQYFKTPVGNLVLGSFNNKLCLCDWLYRKRRSAIDEKIQHELKADFIEEESEVTQIAIQQLVEYFRGERKLFDVQLMMFGTTFQKMIWSELVRIPYGETETYLGLSRRIGNEKAIRAVASANASNALAIFVPCHRVIGSKGKLSGYAGGLNAKKKLLSLEKKGKKSGTT